MSTSMTMGEFLRHRRGSLSPEQVGLVHHGARRVPGLRREEVALLAGVSVTYYTRLEQGHDVNASDSVIDSLARALALTEVEARHLRDLCGVARRRSRGVVEEAPDHARDGTLRLIGNMRDIPCVVLGKRTELLAWNHLGHQLVAAHLDFDVAADPARRPNMTRMLFLDGPTRALYPHWHTEASRSVASLRLLSGRFADDAALARLVGELTLKSQEFSTMWSEHPVTNCMSGAKLMQHPRVGGLELDFEMLSMPDDSGHRLLTYTAEAGSPTATRLQSLRLSPVESSDTDEGDDDREGQPAAG